MLWLVVHKDFIEVTGILLADAATVWTFLVNARVERAKMQFEVIRAHREVWMLAAEERYKGAFDRARNVECDPPTDDEESFVNLAINHLEGCFYASRGRIYAMPEAIREDIQDFLSYPVARRVWEKSKRYRNGAFIAFVDRNSSARS